MEDETSNHESETPSDNEDPEAQKEEADMWCISIILDILVLAWPLCDVVVDWLVICLGVFPVQPILFYWKKYFLFVCN